MLYLKLKVKSVSVAPYQFIYSSIYDDSWMVVTSRELGPGEFPTVDMINIE